MEVHAYTHTPRKKWTHYFWEFLMLFLAVFIQITCITQKSHARDIRIPFDGTPGKFKVITDVIYVELGYNTIISGDGKL